MVMVVKALNVAEKPSVAKELAHILGGGNARRRQGRSQVLSDRSGAKGQASNIV